MLGPTLEGLRGKLPLPIQTTPGSINGTMGQCINIRNIIDTNNDINFNNNNIRIRININVNSNININCNINNLNDGNRNNIQKRK